MPRVELTVSLPSGAWIGAISRDYAGARFRVLSALPTDGGGTGLLEIDASDPDPVLAAVAAADLRDVSVLQRSPTGALVQFETASPMLLRAVQSAGVPITFPFDIRDGEAFWELTLTHDRLSTLRSELDARGLDYRLDRIRGVNVDDDVLTDHQQRVLEAAEEAGYYDQPRGVSLTELARELELAKSTLSGVLRRAESALVTTYTDGDRGADPEPRPGHGGE